MEYSLFDFRYYVDRDLLIPDLTFEGAANYLKWGLSLNYLFLEDAASNTSADDFPTASNKNEHLWYKTFLRELYGWDFRSDEFISSMISLTGRTYSGRRLDGGKGPEGW